MGGLLESKGNGWQHWGLPWAGWGGGVGVKHPNLCIMPSQADIMLPEYAGSRNGSVESHQKTRPSDFQVPCEDLEPSGILKRYSLPEFLVPFLSIIALISLPSARVSLPGLQTDNKPTSQTTRWEVRTHLPKADLFTFGLSLLGSDFLVLATQQVLTF